MRYRSSLTGTCAIPAIGAALALSGCAALQPPPEGKIFERGGVSMVVIPGGSRETYFSDPKALERHCRAPSPDVSITSSDGFSLGLPSPAGRGGKAVSEDDSTGALALGGRSPAVLISRELLYRACELASNLNLPPDQTLRLFRDVMDVVLKLSAVQTGTGTTPVGAKPLDPRVQVPPTGSGPTSGIDFSAPSTMPATIPGTFPP